MIVDINTALLKQELIGRWVAKSWGRECLVNLHERVARIFEEAAELAQAEGLSPDVMHAIVASVVSRPKGKPMQEVGGLAVATLAYGHAKKINLATVLDTEILRAVGLPLDRLQAAHDRKAGIGTAPSHPKNLNVQAFVTIVKNNQS